MKCFKNFVIIAVLLEHLSSEIERLVHGVGFVVTAQQAHLARVVELEAREEQEYLYSEVPAIYIVTETEETRNFEPAPITFNKLVKHLKHIVELAMDVADYVDGRFHFDRIWFFTLQLAEGTKNAHDILFVQLSLSLEMGL